MSHKKRNCDNCNIEYLADQRNLKRGWGLCCSKSCAASKREKSKPSYNIATVQKNNTKRAIWNLSKNAPNVVGGSGIVTGYTSEGYRVMDGIAYDEFDCEVYAIDIYEEN
jgi:hypothetical protein